MALEILILLKLEKIFMVNNVTSRSENQEHQQSGGLPVYG